MKIMQQTRGQSDEERKEDEISRLIPIRDNWVPKSQVAFVLQYRRSHTDPWRWRPGRQSC